MMILNVLGIMVMAATPNNNYRYSSHIILLKNTSLFS